MLLSNNFLLLNCFQQILHLNYSIFGYFELRWLAWIWLIKKSLETYNLSHNLHFNPSSLGAKSSTSFLLLLVLRLFQKSLIYLAFSDRSCLSWTRAFWLLNIIPELLVLSSPGPQLPKVCGSAIYYINEIKHNECQF